MNFYEWLQSLNPTMLWNYKHGMAALEAQVVRQVKESGTINLQVIYDQFFANDSPGFPDFHPTGKEWLDPEGNV